MRLSSDEIFLLRLQPRHHLQPARFHLFLRDLLLVDFFVDKDGRHSGFRQEC